MFEDRLAPRDSGVSLGLVRGLEQIARVADGFRATYERVPTESGDYTMNHSASVFLFAASGRFVTMIDYHEAREFAVPKIRRALAEEMEGAT